MPQISNNVCASCLAKVILAAVQQGGIVEYWGSVRDVVFRQLDADGEVMQGTGLRVQLPGTSLCSEVTSAIRAAGQVGLISLV